jgi:hypothetical protein
MIRVPQIPRIGHWHGWLPQHLQIELLQSCPWIDAECLPEGVAYHSVNVKRLSSSAAGQEGAHERLRQSFTEWVRPDGHRKFRCQHGMPFQPQAYLRPGLLGVQVLIGKPPRHIPGQARRIYISENGFAPQSERLLQQGSRVLVGTLPEGFISRACQLPEPQQIELFGVGHQSVTARRGLDQIVPKDVTQPGE